MAKNKIKTLLRRVLSCCGGGEEQEESRPVTIGEPFDFRREDVLIPGLSDSEQEHVRRTANETAARMTLKSVRPEAGAGFANAHANAHANASPPSARLDRVKAHTRALSNSIKTATANPISGVGAKSAGYSSLSHGHSSATLPNGTNSPYEMSELLAHGGSGNRAGDGGVETTWAGREDDVGGGGGGGGRGLGRSG